MLRNNAKAYRKYFELILKLQSTISTLVSVLLVSMLLIRKWIVIHGYITLIFSPINYDYKYFGMDAKSIVLESLRYLILIPGLMSITLGIILVLAYLRETSTDLVLGILYAYIVVLFVYSYIVIPNTWSRLTMFLRTLGIGREHVVVNVLAGVLELGKAEVHVWEPTQYGINSFILGVLGSFYGIYKGAYES